MRIYVLRFSSSGRLARAVDRLLDSEHVASCAVEPELRQVRFAAPRRHADALVEDLYAEGGLAWCSRHDFRPARLAAAPPALAQELAGR